MQSLSTAIPIQKFQCINTKIRDNIIKTNQYENI